MGLWWRVGSLLASVVKLIKQAGAEVANLGATAIPTETSSSTTKACNNLYYIADAFDEARKVANK